MDYACAFPLMINMYRYHWSVLSDTSPDFSVGFIQIGTWQNEQNSTCAQNDDTCLNVAIVRWGQTANYGYVPNDKMVNTYMATAIDLGDPWSPFAQIHSRYKQPLSKRLAQATKNVVYGESELYWLGPVAQKATLSNQYNNIININFRNVGEKGLKIKNGFGFEVLLNDQWISAANIALNDKDRFSVNVILDNNINGKNVESIRYLWYRGCCMMPPDYSILNCAIYDDQYQLPATPFVINISV